MYVSQIMALLTAVGGRAAVPCADNYKQTQARNGTIHQRMVYPARLYPKYGDDKPISASV
jgi:hypothetical protein